MNIVKVFGTNLRKLRLKKGYSQEKLAELCGLHRTYISDVERFTRNITIENVQRIANALEVDSFKLFIQSESNNETNK